MALIGTVSGSNGTSTTAISGALIIADEPLSRFPKLSTDVKLFVSGNKTTLGADSPNAIFGGDTFVSGALGTDSYFQMKPVNTLRIPTNTTASYIYTSGSTNDMYFTQYNGPYTNTTRLRWLESSLGTGLLHGGAISTANGTTTFSVLSGSGIIVTQNATIGDDPYPTISLIEWPNIVSQSLTYVASDQITYLSVDSAGTINQSPNPPTISQKESNVYLGRVLHQFSSVTNGTITEPAISYGLGESTFNFQRAFGPLKISGHALAVSQSAGLGTLGLTRTAGDSYVEGRNYTLNPNSPNLVLAANDPSLNDCKIFREYTDVSGDPVILTNAGAGYAVIDPTQYNNGGTLAAVNNNEWSNQRVFWYPRSVNRALYVYYGPQKYATFNEAIGGVSTETFVEGANTIGSAVFLGTVTVKANETTLGAADARITQAGLFRGTGGGGGGATSPFGSDTYVQFKDGGSFGGSNDFRFSKTNGVASVANLIVSGNVGGSLTTSGTINVKGAGGTVAASITNAGVISGSGDLRSGGNVIAGIDVIASGTLRSLNYAGDEGGEIFLTGSATSTISNGVTIDVYQNKVRIFESGGTNRGGFWDMASLVAGVGSNLRAASGSQYTYRSVTANDTMTAADSIVGCNQTAAITVKLPLASDCGQGQFFIIKDEAGTAATYNIVVSKSLGSTDTIDGKDAQTLNTNYSSLTIYRGGTGKFFIT